VFSAAKAEGPAARVVRLIARLARTFLMRLGRMVFTKIWIFGDIPQEL